MLGLVSAAGFRALGKVIRVCRLSQAVFMVSLVWFCIVDLLLYWPVACLLAGWLVLVSVTRDVTV